VFHCIASLADPARGRSEPWSPGTSFRGCCGVHSGISGTSRPKGCEVIEHYWTWKLSALETCDNSAIQIYTLPYLTLTYLRMAMQSAVCEIQRDSVTSLSVFSWTCWTQSTDWNDVTDGPSFTLKFSSRLCFNYNISHHTKQAYATRHDFRTQNRPLWPRICILPADSAVGAYNIPPDFPAGLLGGGRFAAWVGKGKKKWLTVCLAKLALAHKILEPPLISRAASADK